MEVALVILTVLVGALLTAQATANVQLNGALGNPAAAAALQLAIAGGLLVVVAAATGELPALAEVGSVPAWELLGGLGSALYIGAGIVLFPRLGALTSMGLFVTGQLAGSVVLDGFGLLGLEQRTPSILVVLGALAVAYGIAAIVRTGRRATAVTAPAARSRTWLYALGLAAGAGLPVQAAVNARLRSELDAPFGAAAVSFGIALTAMVVVLAVALAAGAPRPRPAGLRRVPWWGWAGGLVGAGYVTTTLIAVVEIGAAPTIALTVAGQQIASAVADHRGLLRLPRRPLTVTRLTGVTTLVAGAALIQLG
ncbi:EamA-like transporter family protein [Jiangella aurantiaca]|uniref:EamA-like transporter family protein n=1 Tax=Jiangella aurantiaca TaxID=2530373 RepID=A0A4R5A6R4_9ACTN|nr:DMT family transporter [Jiangella aurantiaca]TDD67651.1 EamA-like transporter family protein [Jiangella aurantiaca]